MNSNQYQQEPLISIGMPVYNEQAYLERTLNSILSQNYDNFELIISDNCSEDGTKQICQQYAANDRRIHYHCNESNIGSSANVVKVVELAQGDYFVLVSGHDYWDHRFLSSCLEILLQDSSVVLCYPQATWIDADDRNLGLIGGVIETRGVDRISRFQMILWGVVYGYPIYGMIRTDALRQSTLGLKVVALDIILLAELSLIGTFAYVSEPLLYVRKLQDYGSWESYIKKIFNQNLSELSASKLFWQMIFQYAQVVERQVDEGEERDTLISLLPACLLVKFNWILTELSSENQQIKPSDIEYSQHILSLTHSIKESTIKFKNLLVGYPQNNIESVSKKEVIHEKTSRFIIIDGVFFQLHATGIARVWRSLLEQWAKTGFAQYLIVLDRANTAPKIAGIRYRDVPPFSYDALDIDSQMLQQVCNEEEADLFISSYYTRPITTPSVFMGYDMIPEVLRYDLSDLMWQQKHDAICHASAYITISENTADDLVRFFPSISRDSISVAHCGVNDLFSPATGEEIDAFKSKHGITNPYFLLVGVGYLNSYKNSTLFLQAYQYLENKEEFDIIVTGFRGDLSEYESYTSGGVIHGLLLSDQELAIAYSGALALVYPSKYEGFGMPVLEAMACGCPVITCPNSSLLEVAGEAAIYVNDDDIQGMTNALYEVQKLSLRQSLITAGLAQATKFSWANMASIVSSALLDASLLSLGINENNLIIFPDWNLSRDFLTLHIEQMIKLAAANSYSQTTTLLIAANEVNKNNPKAILSDAVFNLSNRKDTEISEGLKILLVSNLYDVQWKHLLTRTKNAIK